jgi:hypothetical protein
LIIGGLLLLALGLAWPWLTRGGWWRWFGHLPGDIHIEREGFSFHLPIVTCLLISLLLSGIEWLARR